MRPSIRQPLILTLLLLPCVRYHWRITSLLPVQELLLPTIQFRSNPAPATSSSNLIAESGPRPVHVVPPTVATSDKDLHITVPPAPTKVVLESETGGVTSSAVAPPSSTAEEVAHPRALQAHKSSSGDESDRKSFTEDEGEGVLDIDKAKGEAERLILSGGAGVPIGPVSAMTLLSSTFTDPI